jgi:hypothetical protein
MSIFASNAIAYNITTDNEVANLLSHFDRRYVLDLVQDSLVNRFRINSLNAPNFVYSFEQNFKQILATYPNSTDEIQNVRINTYKEIINIICNFHQLQFNESIEQDFYSTAFYLYQFLISDFTSNLINFFSNYIIKEKNSLYGMLNLGDMKKNKDSSSVYSKKIYKNNNKLGIIHANLEMTIDSICQFDISVNTILSNIYLNKNICKYIESLIVPIQDLFKNTFVPYIYSELRPIIITSIRLRLQELSADIIDIQNN